MTGCKDRLLLQRLLHVGVCNTFSNIHKIKVWLTLILQPSYVLLIATLIISSILAFLYTNHSQLTMLKESMTTEINLFFSQFKKKSTTSFSQPSPVFST